MTAVASPTLWEHVTGRRSRLPLPLIAAGVRWAAAGCWSLATRAELALVENRKEDAIDDYSEAAGLAMVNRDWFALDSSGQQLVLLGELGFRGERIGEPP